MDCAGENLPGAGEVVVVAVALSPSCQPSRHQAGLSRGAEPAPWASVSTIPPQPSLTGMWACQDIPLWAPSYPLPMPHSAPHSRKYRICVGMPLEHPRTEAGVHCGRTTEDWNLGVLPSICCLCLGVTTPLEIMGPKAPGRSSLESQSLGTNLIIDIGVPPPPRFCPSPWRHLAQTAFLSLNKLLGLLLAEGRGEAARVWAGPGLVLLGGQLTRAQTQPQLPGLCLTPSCLHQDPAHCPLV